MSTTAYAGIDGHLNFNIPKVKRKLTKDNLTSVELDSRDAREIISAMHRSYLEPKFSTPWTLQAVDIIVNKQLEEIYRLKKLEMREEGRHSKDVTDQFVYLACKDPFLSNTIAKNGIQAFEKKDKILNALGNSKSGVSLWKHADVQLSVAETFPVVSVCKFLVFKVVLGKCKPVQPCYSPETVIDPTPNYDCHISAISPKIGDPFYPKLMKSQIFFYEYTEDALPSTSPRQCLPYAVLTFSRPKESAPQDLSPLKTAYNNFFRSFRAPNPATQAIQTLSSAVDNSALGRGSYLNRPLPAALRFGATETGIPSTEAQLPDTSHPGQSRVSYRAYDQQKNPNLTSCEGQWKVPPHQPVVSLSGQNQAPLCQPKQALLHAPGQLGTNIQAPGSNYGSRPVLQDPRRSLLPVPQQVARQVPNAPLAASNVRPLTNDPRLARRSSQNAPSETGQQQTSGSGTAQFQYSACEYPSSSDGEDALSGQAKGLKLGNTKDVSSPDPKMLNKTPQAVSPVALHSVQQSLTDSHMAMLKQALSISQLSAATPQLGSPDINAVPATASGPPVNFGVGSVQQAGHDVGPKLKTGKQKLSLESYRLMKRRGSSQPNQSPLESSTQPSVLLNPPTTPSALTTRDGEAAPVVDSVSNVDTKSPVIASPVLKSKGILKTDGAEMDQENPSESPIKDLKLIVKTETVMPDEEKSYVDALTSEDGLMDRTREGSPVIERKLFGRISRPGTPLSSTSSTCSVDSGSVHSSLANSPSAGQTQVKPAQKKKKVNRIMIGYKKRRRKKKGKAKGKAVQEEAMIKIEDIKQEIDDSPEKVHLTAPEKELTERKNPLPEKELTEGKSPLPEKELTERKNPLWELSSPVNDNEIEYNDFDFSFDLPHFFESSPVKADPSTADSESSIQPRQFTPHLSLQSFGLLHWSQALADLRFQPKVRLGKIQVETEDDPEEPMTSDYEVEEEKLVSIADPSLNDKPKERLVKEKEDIPSCSDMDISEIEESPMIEINVKTPVVPDIITPSDSVSRDLNKSWDEVAAPTSLDRRLEVKEEMPDFGLSASFGQTPPKKPSLGSILCDLSEIDAAIDRDMKMNKNLYSFPKIDFDFSRFNVKPKKTTEANQTDDQEVKTQEELDRAVSMEAIHKVAVNILPYMKGKSALSMEEISATIASILGPPPVAETVEPSDSPQTNVVLEELDTTSTFLWPQSPEESDPMEHENTASEIPLVRESSPEEPLVSHTTGQVESPAENPGATPGPTGSESPVTLMPASSTTYDALYSAYSPQRHEQAFAESAEQTAAKWFSQMAQMCNVQNKDVEKENKDFFEAVKTTLNMNLTLKKPLPQKQISTTTDEGKVESCITKKMVLETKTPLASAVVKVEAKPIVKSEVKHTETSEAPSQPIQKEEKIDNKAKIKARRKLKKLRKREKKLKQEKLKEQKLKEEILKELQLKELQLKIKEEKEERGVVTVTASTLTQGNQERLVVDNRMTMELKSPLEPSNSFEKLRSLKQAKPVTKQIKEDKINSASMTGITEQSGQTDILKWFEDMIKPKQDGQSAVNKPTLNLSSVDQTLKKGPRRSSCSPFRRPRRSRSSSRFSSDSRSRSSSRNSLERYPRYKRSTSRSPRRYERRPSRDTTSVSSGMSRFSERSRDRRRRSSSFSSSDRSRSRSPFRRRRSYSPKRPLTLQSSWSPPRGSLNSWSWWEKKWPREGKSSSRSPRRHSSLSRNRSSRSRSPRYKPIRDRKSRSRSPKRRNSSNLSAGSRSPKRIRSNNSRSKSSSPRRKSPSRRDKRSRSRSPRRKRRKSGSRSPKRNKSRSRSPTRYGLRDKKSRSRSPQSKRRQSRSKSTTRSLSKDNKVQSSMDRRTVSVGKKSRSGSPIRKLAGRPRSRSRSPGKKVEKNRKSRSKSPSRRYDKALGPSEDKKARSKNDKKSRSGSPKCQGKGPRSQSPRNSENRFKKYRSPSPRKRPLLKNTDHKHPVKTSDPENLQRYCRRETKSHSRSPKDKKSNSSTQRLNDVNSVDKNSGSESANISSDKKLQPESSNCSATDVKEKDLPDSRRKSCFSSFEKTAVEISKPNVHVIENILTDRMADVKMANEVVSGPNKASGVPAVMCEMKSPACASSEDIISVKEMMFEELCHKKTRQQSGQSKTSDKDGAEVEFPGATTLDDLASERERLLSELCGLNSGSDCESVSSLLSNGSINKTIDKKLRKSQVCQLVSRSPSHVPEYDVQNIVLLNEALGMGSIKSVSTHNVEYPLSSSSLYSKRGLLNDPAYGNKAKDFVARNLSSNDNWNLGTDDFCESQLQKPQVRQVGATWGAIVSNIHKEKQEVIRGCGTIDGPAIKPEMDQLKSGEEPTVTDPFAEECRIALAKIEKTKRRSNHELHSGPLNAWLSLILPKDNKSYDLVLTRLCKSLQLKPSEKFCDLGKGKKKEVRSTAERLARLVKDMEESTYYEIILPPLHCPDCCTKTVGQWLAMGINSSTPLYQSFLKEVCLSAGVPEYIKVTALSKVASEKLMESVRDCCRLLQKLGRQGDSETHSDTTANTESVKISESTTTNFQAPELHGGEKFTDKTLLSISRNICNSCGRNSEHLGLTFAVNRLKEIKPLVTKASLFFKEYVKHMKVVLWNAKVFKTVRFKLDQALSMLNAVNSLSQAVKRHFSCLVPASENVAKVLFMSKFLYFKRHQAKVNLVISYIDSAERLICEALDRATVQHNAMKVEMEGASEDILSCSECLKYIHGSACPEKTPDFISLDPADACVTKPGPTTTATGFGNSEECSTIATMQTECTREQVPPEVMALFGQMQKSLEMSDGDCKLKGTGKYEKISDDLLLPTEIENGVLYGGRCLYLRRNLRDKVAQQLARCKSNILRINECLSRRPDPTQEKAKVRMLNLRWNLLTRYTFKLNPEKSGRPGLLQKEAQVLEQCLEWHGKSGFPEIEVYQTDPILELIKTHLERIDTAIQLVETGLAKMRSEKASSLFPGSLCQGEEGLVSGSETDCLSSSSLLGDQTDNPDPSIHKVGGTQYSELDKRECAMLSQSDSNDGSGIQITYFASKYDVLEPSEFHTNSSAAFQTCGDTRRSLIVDQGDLSPADSCGWNEDRRTAVAVGADTRTIVAYDDDSAELHSRQQCPSSSIPRSGRNEQWGGNPIATMCSRRPVNQSCYTGNVRQRNFKGNQGGKVGESCARDLGKAVTVNCELLEDNNGHLESRRDCEDAKNDHPICRKVKGICSEDKTAGDLDIGPTGQKKISETLSVHLQNNSRSVSIQQKRTSALNAKSNVSKQVPSSVSGCLSKPVHEMDTCTREASEPEKSKLPVGGLEQSSGNPKAVKALATKTSSTSILEKSNAAKHAAILSSKPISLEPKIQISESNGQIKTCAPMASKTLMSAASSNVFSKSVSKSLQQNVGPRINFRSEVRNQPFSSKFHHLRCRNPGGLQNVQGILGRFPRPRQPTAQHVGNLNTLRSQGGYMCSMNKFWQNLGPGHNLQGNQTCFGSVPQLRNLNHVQPRRNFYQLQSHFQQGRLPHQGHVQGNLHRNYDSLHGNAVTRCNTYSTQLSKFEQIPRFQSHPHAHIPRNVPYMGCDVNVEQGNLRQFRQNANQQGFHFNRPFREKI